MRLLLYFSSLKAVTMVSFFHNFPRFGIKTSGQLVLLVLVDQNGIAYVQVGVSGLPFSVGVLFHFVLCPPVIFLHFFLYFLTWTVDLK